MKSKSMGWIVLNIAIYKHETHMAKLCLISLCATQNLLLSGTKSKSMGWIVLNIRIYQHETH